MAQSNPALRQVAQDYGVDVNQKGSSTAPTPTNEVLNEMFNTPSADTGRVTLDDVIIKTGIAFAFTVVGSIIGWIAAPTMPWLVIGAMIVGLVLSLVNVFKKSVNPLLVIGYAFFQGIFLGAISYSYNLQYEGIVKQAVIGTFVAFAVMLGLYKSRIIKVTKRSQKIFMIMLVSYALIGLVSLVAALFGVGGGWGFYGVGTLGLILCAFGVALAAYSLVMDFDLITRVVANGAPEREAWRMAFGLMMTLIWLYLEILRLLAIVNRR